MPHDRRVADDQLPDVVIGGDGRELVRVAAGADNLQDPFNPVGRACPMETAGLMVSTAHLLPHHAYESVSVTAASVIGAPPAALEVGAGADLVAVRAATLREAIAFGPSDRIVWRRGRRLSG